MATENVTADNQQEPQQAQAPATGNEPAEVDWEAKYKEAVAQSRKWEERSKANKEKADKWDAYEQEGMSEAEKLAKRAESAEAELARLKSEAKHRTDAHEVSEKTKVPESLLLHCATREDMEAFAGEYAQLLEDQPLAPIAPPAPSSRVIRGGDAKKTTADLFADAFGDML